MKQATSRDRRLAGLVLAIAGMVAGGVMYATTATATEQVTFCHAAGLDGTTHYVTLTVGYPAAFGPAGHFDENGTPNAGHEQDYLGACLPDTSTSTTVPDDDPPPTTTTTECPDCTPGTVIVSTTTTVPPGDDPPDEPPTIIPPVTVYNPPAGIPATGGATPALVAPSFTG